MSKPHTIPLSVLGDNPSLQDAKDLTLKKARRPRGVACPCCSKFVKVYTRKFNSCMARTMVYTYKYFKSNKGYLDVAHYMLEQLPGWVPSDYGKLVWWGLMEVGEDSGMYRMTERGKLFVEQAIQIPEFAREYRSEVESFSESTIDIESALGEHFNYQELMALGVSEINFK